MYICDNWKCSKCDCENIYEGLVEDFASGATYTHCGNCGTSVYLKGFIELFITDAEIRH